MSTGEDDNEEALERFCDALGKLACLERLRVSAEQLRFDRYVSSGSTGTSRCVSGLMREVREAST